MIAPPLSCNAMDVATLMEKVNMVFTRLDTNKDVRKFHSLRKVTVFFFAGSPYQRRVYRGMSQ